MRCALAIGAMLGFFLAAPVSLLAQGSPMEAWMQPPVVMSLIGIVISLGGARQMVIDDRRRIALLESQAISREVFQETMKRIDGSLDRLTQWANDARRP